MVPRQDKAQGPHPLPPRLAEQAKTDEGLRAFKLFCTPSRSSRRADNHDELVERARFHLRATEVRAVATRLGRVQTYTFTPNSPPVATALLVHGWTGEAAFMGAFGDFLRRRGMRAILMDMPAHGESEGQEASLFDCAAAVLDVAEAVGPVQFGLGHSVGAMALLAAGEGHYPLPRAYPFEAYVLVSMPNAFADITRDFAAEHGLGPGSRRNFEQRLEQLAGRSISQFTGNSLLRTVARPSLLLHARDDAEVPFDCALAMAETTPGVTLKAFDNLGHRAILYAPPAVKEASAFLMGRTAAL